MRGIVREDVLGEPDVQHAVDVGVLEAIGALDGAERLVEADVVQAQRHQVRLRGESRVDDEVDSRLHADEREHVREVGVVHVDRDAARLRLRDARRDRGRDARERRGDGREVVRERLHGVS